MCLKNARQSRILKIFGSNLILFAVAAPIWLGSIRAASAQGTAADESDQPAPAKKLNPFRAAMEAQRARSNGAAAARPGADRFGQAEEVETGPAALTFGSAPFDLVSLAPLFKTPEPDAESDDGPVLTHEALRSWKAGDQTTALRLMFAHMAAEYDDASPTIDKVKYSKLLKRPVWNVRFGISMWVRDGRSDGESPAPIPGAGGGNARPFGAPANPNRPAANVNPFSRASLANAANNRNSRSRATNNRRDRTANPRAGSASQPNRATGNRATGNRAAGNRAAANGAAPPNAGQPAAAPAPVVAKPDPDPEISEMLGMVAEVVGDEFSARYERGDFGQLLVDLTATKDDQTESSENLAANPSPAANPNPGAATIRQQALEAFGARGQRAAAALAGRGGAAADDAKPPQPAAPAVNTLTSANSLPIWKPGIVNLGNGSTKEMIQKADRSELDFLIHFEIILKSRPGSTVHNVSRCRLINVATGKTIALSKPMDNNEEKKLSGSSGGREYVYEQIDSVLAVFERDIKVTELPKLTPEVARRRLGMLLGNRHQRSLRTLAEIRLYEKRDLLTHEEVEKAFDIIGGTDSLIFLYGRAEDRAAMARAWAAEAGEKERS